MEKTIEGSRPGQRSANAPRSRPATGVLPMLAAMVSALLLATQGQAATWVVAESGGDFESIQAALDAAQAGDRVVVHAKSTPYFEKVSFPRSGDAQSGFISLEAAEGSTPILDGTGVPGANMVLIEDRSWVRIVGFEIRNNLDVDDGSGVRVLGAGDRIEIRDNEIHEIRGSHAMGITVYGTRPEPISNLVIDGNTIHDCDPAQSEALTLNGNVTGFQVTNNIVRDVDNIAIDFIGGETDIQPDHDLVARNGVCAGNLVERARSSYGGGYAAGIYVDGGRDIVIENNVVTQSDLGIEVGAENPGQTTRGIVVRNNLLYENDKAGLVFGGYASSVGRVTQSEFRNNTFYRNDTLGAGYGEIWVQWASENVVRNNIVHGGPGRFLLTSWGNGNQDNTFDYNLWYSDVGASSVVFVWNDLQHTGFEAYRSAQGQDGQSLFVDPLLVAPQSGDMHIDGQSPAINAGDPATSVAVGEADLDGSPRLSGPRVDIGADEISCGDGVPNPGEACDDGNGIDGDGCDSNCTITGCGNGIVTTGETCDDGNSVGGDCCSPSCQQEPAGTSCDDGRPCTRQDQCSSGVCVGSAEPDPSCRAAGKASMRLFGGRPEWAKIVYTWKKGEATAVADFGSPDVEGGADFSVCLLDGNGTGYDVVFEETVSAGGACDGRDCWKALGAKGFRYSDGSGDGIGKMILKAGPEGRPKIKLKAQGAGALVELPLGAAPDVVMEMRTAPGECWSARLDAPPRANDSFRYIGSSR
jgi:cysteine-rich repeat protein